MVRSELAVDLTRLNILQNLFYHLFIFISFVSVFFFFEVIQSCLWLHTLFTDGSSSETQNGR